MIRQNKPFSCKSELFRNTVLSTKISAAVNYLWLNGRTLTATFTEAIVTHYIIYCVIFYYKLHLYSKIRQQSNITKRFSDLFDINDILLYKYMSLTLSFSDSYVPDNIRQSSKLFFKEIRLLVVISILWSIHRMTSTIYMKHETARNVTDLLIAQKKIRRFILYIKQQNLK